ncbi:hypothetical protein GCM10023169_08630 [Georgenia halophila]|uniref:Uncharacterized protein n=1 Tax=Georgenia halophila TaxID=620889 RepID=A0ABP8KZG3_9MICO
MSNTLNTNDDASRRRAPLGSYVLAVACALLLAAAFGTLAALLRDQDALLTGVVFGICALAPFLALFWLVLVSRHTVTSVPHAEESVERQWLDRATSGGFTDVLAACGIALTGVAITGLEVSGLAVLTAVVALAMVDVAVRYAVLSRRES